ncbi:MAG: hydrogenase iron-sulfur subunit [Thermodesulfobacteriota bacterium]|nr:hydrogenase iron-sulfur subunit [Thermodesulfobacteriota bacterium]
MDFKILFFLCNWAPWSCYLEMGENKTPLPGEVKVIRVMCASRIIPAHILKAFSVGADGVLIGSCMDDNCQNLFGPSVVQDHIVNTGELMELLGLKKERLALKKFFPHESEEMAREVEEFLVQIKKMGKSPIAATF